MNVENLFSKLGTDWGAYTTKMDELANDMKHLKNKMKMKTDIAKWMNLLMEDRMNTVLNMDFLPFRIVTSTIPFLNARIQDVMFFDFYSSKYSATYMGGELNSL